MSGLRATGDQSREASTIKLSSSQPLTSAQVEPSRLAHGQWCHQRNRQQGEGDINASYSADMIGMHSRVRRPFRLQGWICVVTSISQGVFTAYRLLPPEAFLGKPTTYAEKVHSDGGEVARHDPKGFYHGMQVSRGTEELVLTGPPTEITAGEAEPEQAELF